MINNPSIKTLSNLVRQQCDHTPLALPHGAAECRDPVILAELLKSGAMLTNVEMRFLNKNAFKLSDQFANESMLELTSLRV